MASAGVPMDGWKSFARNFSRTHDGWAASVELRDETRPRKVVIDDRLFRGLTFEEHAGHKSLILTFGDEADEHLAHIIEHPESMAFLEWDHGNSASVLIDAADGSACVLELVNPLREADNDLT